MIATVAAFIALLFAGIPIVIALGAVMTIYLLITGSAPIEVMAHRFYSGLNSFTLLAIPFFVLSGLLMEAGGLSRRIVDFADALVGWIRGGLLMVAVFAATLLAAMSGSGSADTAAVSTVLQPELRRRRYDIDFSGALIASAATTAQVIPPSLMLVIIAVQNNLSVGALFLAGILPGLACSALLMVIAWHHARGNTQIVATVERFDVARVGRSFLAALPALGMAVIILGGILGGFMTPTEAAGSAVVYALAVGILVYRELDVLTIGRVLVRAAVYSAGLLLLVGTANIFNWLVADSGVLDDLGAFMGETLTSRLAFLFAVNVLLMLLGMFIEGIAIILLLSTILIELGGALGVDPNHMAVIIVLNCAIGLVTPPFGATLFVAAMVIDRPFEAISRRVALPWAALVVALALTTAFPDFALFLPRHFGFIT